MMSDQETLNDKMGKTPEPSAEFPIPLLRYYVFECATNVFRSLLGEVGADQVFEAAKGYSKVWGINTASMAKQRFGLKGNEVEEIALSYYWLHYSTSWGRIKPLEIREKGAVVELFVCPVTEINAPPEICVAMSHNIAQGLCHAINPEYEFVFTHHLSNNDGRCRYIIKKKSSKTNLDDLGSLKKTIPLNLSQDEINMVSGGVCYNSLNAFTSMSVDLIGSERTLELAVPQAKELGVKVGKNLMGNSGGDGNIQTIKDKLEVLHSIQGHTGTLTLLSESRLEREVQECPCKGSTPEVCMQFEAISNGVCEAINPDYEFAYDRMMSKGDPTCHWVVRQKQKPKEGSSSEDPTKNLALRLSKGEISLEEFEKNIAALRKHGVIK